MNLNHSASPGPSTSYQAMDDQDCGEDNIYTSQTPPGEIGQETHRSHSRYPSHEGELPIYDNPMGSMFSGPPAESVPTSATSMLPRPRSMSNRRAGNISDGPSLGSTTRSHHKKLGGQHRARKNYHSTGAYSSGASRAGSPKITRSKARRTSSSSAESNEAPVGFFSNISAIFKGKGREPSDLYRTIRTTSRGRLPSSSRSIRSAASSRHTTKSSVFRKSRLAPPASYRDNSCDDEGFLYEVDDSDCGSNISSASTSTSNSDPSSSESSNTRRRTNRALLGLPPSPSDTRVEIIPLAPTYNYHSLDGSQDELKFMDSSVRQSVYFVDEDMQIQFFGWASVLWKSYLWKLNCALSCGLLWLIGRWKMDWKLRRTGSETDFSNASHLVIKTSTGDSQVVRLETLVFNDSLPLATVFPPSLKTPPAYRAQPSPSPSEFPTAASDIITHSSSAETCKLAQIKYFDFRYHRFFLHPVTMQFRLARDWQDPSWSTSLLNLGKGLDFKDSRDRRQLFGENDMDVKGKSTVQILLDEALHPFYLFQIASIVLWSLDDYYYYALCIAAISISSILTTLFETKRNLARLQDVSRFTCEVTILRGATWTSGNSTELVPGDLIDVSAASLHTFPADLLLLSGDAIVNESMLTGESIPVSKIPASESTLKQMSNMVGDPSPTLAKHILFCGTKIIRIRRSGRASLATSVNFVQHTQEVARAMVIRTAFNTTKGALIRSMLFPKPIDFAFYRDSFRFIGALGLIAGLGFVASGVNFLRMGIQWKTILVRALDLITIVVPPALPATMSIGTSFAMSRLRKLGIFCISPNRVNIGGKINLACFDKTGTLTEEGLDVLGVRTVNRLTGEFSVLYDEIEDVPILGVEETPIMHALATCHGLKVVNGQVIGDPLDLKMFQFTRWSIEEGDEGSASAGIKEHAPSDSTPKDKRRSDSGKKKKSKSRSSQTHSSQLAPPVLPGSLKTIERQSALVQTIVRPPGGTSFEIEDALKSARFLELGILRTFDFASALRRMSVVVGKPGSASKRGSGMVAYVKGAPEAMVDICLKDTLPQDYEEVLKDYTRNGYRVIAVAAKSLKVNWRGVQRLHRSDVESELRFLGFIVFENKLKPGTEPSIHILKNAHIGIKMCTGDNIRTAISVGRESGMISDEARVYMPVFASGSQALVDSRIVWFDIDDETRQLDPYLLQPVHNLHAEEEQSVISDRSRYSSEYVLALSGDVFRWIMDYGALETVQRMLYKTTIFARMSPDEKHELVERLQGLDYTVGFCGDGANDCGALKAADVGLSLSEAEASVAAPFTSRVPDISCFIEVIREGRCALVTSFSCFKYMALYSLIQFTTITLLYSLPSSLGDFQFLYIDLFVIIPIAIAMGRTHPYGRLVPKRPTANLVSKRVLISLIGQIAINSLIQAIVFWRVRSQEWYHEAPRPDPEERLPASNPENSTLFLVSIFQYVLVAATFSVGPPYRKEIFTNSFLVLCLSTLGGFSTYMLFVDSGLPYRILELVPLSREFRLELALFVILNIFASIMFETYATQPIALWIGGRLKKLRRLRHSSSSNTGKREQKLYKAVAQSMEQ